MEPNWTLSISRFKNCWLSWFLPPEHESCWFWPGRSSDFSHILRFEGFSHSHFNHCIVKIGHNLFFFFLLLVCRRTLLDLNTTLTLIHYRFVIHSLFFLCLGWWHLIASVAPQWTLWPSGKKVAGFHLRPRAQVEASIESGRRGCLWLQLEVTQGIPESNRKNYRLQENKGSSSPPAGVAKSKCHFSSKLRYFFILVHAAVWVITTLWPFFLIKLQ